MVALVAAVVCAAGAGAARAQPAHLAPGDVARGAIEPEPPDIELWTFGVGERIFEKFGHAAICLRYHRPEHPAVCFNYGVTDFTAGAAMVWNFLRGQQRFWVEPSSLSAMQRFYEREDRDIWRQRLPITGDDARAIEARLWSDVREENRYYVYDHFYDNCATRVRDLIDPATHGALRAGGDAPYPRTFRELGRRGLAGMPLLLMTSDLVTGRQLDEQPTRWQAMFLPEVLRTEVAARLHATPELVYRHRGPAFPVRGSTGRLDFLAVAVACALPLFGARWVRRFETAALVWATLGLALLGAAVWGLAVVSPLPGLRYNEAVFVTVPLDAVLPVLAAGWQRRYARVRLAGLALVSALGIVGAFHQPLWTLIVAVVLPMVTIAFDLPHGRVSAPA